MALIKHQARLSRAFLPTHTPHPPKQRPLITSSKCNWHCSYRPTRRRFLHEAAVFPSAIATALTTTPQSTYSAEKLSKLEDAVVPVIMCRKIMTPVRRYITEGEWDKGRTNVNYCTRVLALRTRMRDAAQLLEGDAFYEATEIMGEMTNIMSQLDASLYTPLFIPSDEGISVEQRKYQKQAFAFYEDALRYLEQFLSIVPQDSVDKARKVAATARYEIKFEDE